MVIYEADTCLNGLSDNLSVCVGYKYNSEWLTLINFLIRFLFTALTPVPGAMLASSPLLPVLCSHLYIYLALCSHHQYHFHLAICLRYTYLHSCHHRQWIHYHCLVHCSLYQYTYIVFYNNLSIYIVVKYLHQQFQYHQIIYLVYYHTQPWCLYYITSKENCEMMLHCCYERNIHMHREELFMHACLSWLFIHCKRCEV